MFIGVNGQIGSGKDAFYERSCYLQEHSKFRAFPAPERRAFADKLKDSFGALFGLSREQIELLKRDDQAIITVTTPRLRVPVLRRLFRKVWSRFTIRLGLQREGTDAGRDVFGDTFWLDHCVPLDLDHRGQLIIVTDVRFPNEAERIRAAGGIVVRMLNGPLAEPGHASEQILPGELIDVEIDNSRRDDNFAALDDQVQTVMERVRVDEGKRNRPRRARSKTRKVSPVTPAKHPVNDDWKQQGSEAVRP